MAWIDGLLNLVVEHEASDLHLTSNVAPHWRLHGDIQPVPDYDETAAEELLQHLMEITPADNQDEFKNNWDSDFAYEIEGVGRFRVNLFFDRRGPGAVLRHIPQDIPSADALRLPEAVLDFCNLSKGLVVVTGPTGSGKSTTLAALIDHINRHRTDHVITIEDPVEFVHPNRHCLVHQREVHRHTGSFKRALRAALREDPDIVLVGEMRDLETIEIAIETAETGHLVFGTLHTTTAASTVDRVIDQFPADRQAQIRTMLSTSLKGVVAQTLCKKQGGGRIAAHEILVVNAAISSLIREGKTYQIESTMQVGSKTGMCLLNDTLLRLVKNGMVDPTEAYMKAAKKSEFIEKLDEAGYKIDAAQGPTSSMPKNGASQPQPGPEIVEPIQPQKPKSPSADPFEEFRRLKGQRTPT